MKRYIFLAISAFAALAFFAQQISITRLPTQKALPMSHLHRIFQDSEGYMWYGTDGGGLCRDNGYQIDVFRPGISMPSYSQTAYFSSPTMKSSMITCIAEDSSGHIWFGTRNGLYLIDKKDYVVKTVPCIETQGRQVNALMADSHGSVWVSLNNAIYQFSPAGKLIKKYYPAGVKGVNVVSTFTEDSHRTVWAACWIGGIIRYDSRTDRFVSEEWPKTLRPIQMIEDAGRNYYWVATWGGGIVRFDPNKNSDRRVAAQPATTDAGRKPYGSEVMCIVQDKSQGLLWASTMDDIYAYRIKNGQLIPYSTDAFIPKGKKIIDRLYEDRAGNIWVPGYSPHTFAISFTNDNIQRYEVEAQSRTTTYPLLADAVCEDGGMLWIWQGRIGLTLYDPKSNQIIYAAKNPETQSYAIGKCVEKCADMPGIWATSGSKLLRLWHEGMKMRLKEIATLPPSKPIHSISESSGRLIVGAGNAIYEYTIIGGKLRKLCSLPGTPSSITTTKDGKCYAIVERKGIARFDLSGHAQIINGKEEFANMAATPQGIVWASTQQGNIYSYDPEKGTWTLENKACQHYGGYVRDLQADGIGHVWILTEQEVKEYNPANHASRTFRCTDEQIGMGMFLSLQRIGDDKICIGGDGAFVILPPSADLDHAAMQSVKPIVTSFAIDGRRSIVGKGQKEITIEPGQSNIEVFISTLDILNSQKTSYAYRLKGMGKEWTYLPQGSNVAHFNYLPNGNYELEVKATNQYGSWGKPTVCISIDRLPAWYETWWAYLVYAIMAFAMSAGLLWLKRRIHYLVVLQRKRREILLDNVELKANAAQLEDEDKESVKKAVRLTEQNLSNANYSVTQLSSDMNMSRQSLYNKIQKVTGQSPTEFIRAIRLKKAASLINATDMPMSKIMKVVGFTTPSYFTKCFKEMFGVTPSQYGKQEKEKDASKPNE